MSNIIKNTNTQNNVKNHIFQPFLQPQVSKVIHSTNTTKQIENEKGILDLYIRSGRSQDVIYNQDLLVHNIINEFMRGQVR